MMDAYFRYNGVNTERLCGLNILTADAVGFVKFVPTA